MKKILLILFFLFCVFPSYTFAFSYKDVSVGQLQKGDLTLVYENAVIPTYKLYDTHYILTSDLQYLGCTIEYLPTDRSITISAPISGITVPKSSQDLTNQSASIYSGNITIGQFETQGLVCNGRTMIPLAALDSVGMLDIVDGTCTYVPEDALPVDTTQTTISNLSDVDLNVTILDIYWNGEAVIIPSSYTLAPNTTIERPIPVNSESTIYISTLVQRIDSVNTLDYSYYSESFMGQLNSKMMEKYTKYTTRSFLESYGDSIAMQDVIAAEEFINRKNLSSPTPYLVWTNTNTQRTYIFQGSKNNWSLYKHFICSTGKDRTPTPKGTYALTRKVSSFGQNKGYCCKYAFGFIGTTYLYHSIIYDRTGSYLLEGKGVLGKKASDGCIRFSTENAKWFYDNMISGTTVYIS